jgi:hypothetical protein
MLSPAAYTINVRQKERTKEEIDSFVVSTFHKQIFF